MTGQINEGLLLVMIIYLIPDGWHWCTLFQKKNNDVSDFYLNLAVNSGRL